MLKYILLATSMCIAAPAYAQETTPPDTQTQDQTPVSEPAPAAPETPPAAEPAATPTAANPAPGETAMPAALAQPVAEAATPATPAPTAPAAQAAAATPAAPAQTPTRATTQDQIAQVVNAEFGNYDKDGNGALDKSEFSTWMVALRKASDPSFAAETPEGQTWLAGAFAQADADKNAGVNATELASFLTPKPAA